MANLTAEITPNGKAIIIRKNQAPDSWRIDFSTLTVPISNIELIVEEDNEGDGININFSSGKKYTLKPGMFDQVGAIVGVENLATNSQLCNAFNTLAGF